MIQRIVNWQRATSLSFSLLTDVFSRGSGIVPDLSEHKLRVDDDLVSELRDDGGQEAVAPGVDVVGAPEEVEQQPDHHQAEAVGVEHVLGGAGRVPLPHVERPPGAAVPRHAGQEAAGCLQQDCWLVTGDTSARSADYSGAMSPPLHCS